jgi:hypothetical protein
MMDDAVPCRPNKDASNELILIIPMLISNLRALTMSNAH